MKWSDLRKASGQVGEAVARRLYPRARPRGGPVDFVLPGGGALEAKAAHSHGAVHFSFDQREILDNDPEALVAITVYDATSARAMHSGQVRRSRYPSGQLGLECAIARAAVAVVTCRAEHLFAGLAEHDVDTSIGYSLDVRAVLRWALEDPLEPREVFIPARVDFKTATGAAGRLSYKPIAVLGARSPWFSTASRADRSVPF